MVRTQVGVTDDAEAPSYLMCGQRQIVGMRMNGGDIAKSKKLFGLEDDEFSNFL